MRTPPSPVPVAGPRCLLGESPRWDGAAWWWLDVVVGAVYRMPPGAAAQLVLRTGRRASFVAPLGRDRLVLADETRLLRLTVADGDVRLEPWVELPVPDGWLLNDGCIGPDGSVWTGSVPPAGAAAAGDLIRVGVDGTISAPASGFALSNGLGWLDQRTLLHADSRTGVVWRHEFTDDFELTGSSEYLRIPAAQGMPDGLAIDPSGLVWLALYGGAAVLAIRNGRIVSRVAMPTAQTTAVAIGGPAGGELLVTTAQEGFDAARSAAEPLAGRVFRCRVGAVPGPTMNASEERV
ncbi:SMP-30/gluconolactonase/LRE family protein [Kribbella sp.]|uniref:SMP-30/gluconolactonase/LRE family protein n=1 Tax=Kribbella sp. TaxID=1871183 RepID=UPI002D4D6D46|nr:SMP-30/gluconolactonase/LRE family protein [Kribbella sp.]HZX07807.1 SMP-30/gluconolactonase/LRE family protein [Kribbella sp.]